MHYSNLNDFNSRMLWDIDLHWDIENSQQIISEVKPLKKLKLLKS